MKRYQVRMVSGRILYVRAGWKGEVLTLLEERGVSRDKVASVRCDKPHPSTRKLLPS